MSAPRLRILIADDEVTARLLLKATLEKHGFAVGQAEDGIRALEEFRAARFDMVMLDVEMPGMNGFEVCAELRRLSGGELPIVMVTGMDDLDSVERAFEAGATDFISKPINWALVGHRVRYLFRGYQVLQDLHAANARNAAILNAIPDTLLRLDDDGLLLDLRPGATRVDVAKLPPPGTSLFSLATPEFVVRYRKALAKARASGAAQTLDYAHAYPDDGERHFEVHVAPIQQQETLVLVRDVTARKRQELEVVTARNKLRDTLNAIPDLLFELDAEGRYLDYHSPDDALLAAPPAQMLGRTVNDILPPEAASTCMAALREAGETGSSSGKQFELDLPVGKRWFELSVSRKSRVDGERADFIVLSRDISARKEAERNVYRLAYYDTLTGLPNRLSFAERLEREARRARHQQQKLAVLFLDLDGFKAVNDTLGHGAGDLLLQRVADRLRQSTRPDDMIARTELDETEIELARLGGDEFTLLVPHLAHSEDALKLARRIHDAMRRPFLLEDRSVIVTASIGIAMFPDDGEDAATLLKHADTAMYHAKDVGRDNYQFYSVALTDEAIRRMNLETDLRLALERKEFHLVYQPQLDLESGRVLSLEALLRWQHPVQGPISPMEFIPIAEENGLIVEIGEWVLQTACRDAARWLAQGTPLTVAVNLSAVQFRNPGLLETIRGILTDCGLPPGLLELEVTEGVLMEDTTATVATLNALRQTGMQLSLDDFGTGYSSLNYLKRLPLNNLKVDQSFVRGLPADRESLAIVRAIVSLAKNLGFTITAEGIETAEQAHILQALGSEILQGYFISRPVAAAAIPELLKRDWRRHLEIEQ